MRIGLISTLCTPVKQEGSDSVETLVWLLARHFHALGHSVTVFATAASEPAGELVAVLPGPYGRNGSPGDWHTCEWINLCAAVQQAARFDILHSHVYMWGLPLSSTIQTPMVHTTHILPDIADCFLRSRFPQACVTGVSQFQWSRTPDLGPAAVIRNGIDPAQFPFEEQPADYLCYLGRLTRSKGVLEAISIARAIGMPLWIAGRRNRFYDEEVSPLVDGESVRFVGHLAGAERSAFLGKARAILYPIQAPETFGLVLAEAMMCGTPVAAMRCGAVPEIVEEGVGGYTGASVEELVAAACKCLTLDRRRVRESVIGRFSAERMGDEYLEFYRSVLANG